MKRFLMIVGSIGLGWATVMDAFLFLTLVSGPATTTTYQSSPSAGDTASLIFGGVCIYAVAVVFALALSAPFAFDPPDNFRQLWIWVPFILLPVVWALKFVGWIGNLQLRFYWWLLSLVWSRVRRPPAVPAYSAGYPGGYPATPVQYQPRQAVGPAGPSWQNDPTGRYMRRFWDGNTWTAWVANGDTVASDPL